MAAAGRRTRMDQNGIEVIGKGRLGTLEIELNGGGKLNWFVDFPAKNIEAFEVKRQNWGCRNDGKAFGGLRGAAAVLAFVLIAGVQLFGAAKVLEGALHAGEAAALDVQRQIEELVVCTGFVAAQGALDFAHQLAAQQLGNGAGLRHARRFFDAHRQAGSLHFGDQAAQELVGVFLATSAKGSLDVRQVSHDAVGRDDALARCGCSFASAGHVECRCHVLLHGTQRAEARDAAGARVVPGQQVVDQRRQVAQTLQRGVQKTRVA